MNPAPIRALRPNVSQAEALRAFSRPGISSMFWRLRAGTLQRIADAYVPYQFYEVSYVMGRAPQTRLFAMDAVDGSLDLFEFPHVPEEAKTILLETRNRLEPALADASADELLREKVLRAIFQQGFFKVRDATIKFSRQSTTIYMPYWLGFYAAEKIVRCRVMDAVRRRMEGAKASTFFEEWLAA